MSYNIINAIINMVQYQTFDLTEHVGGNNRANDMGTALEEYIKNLFSGSFGLSDKDRLEKWQEAFSYLGNNSNPPDIVLKNGDAIEVKKIQTAGASLALNSSYPKHTLKATNPLISSACKEAEEWEEKDMIYAIGVVNGCQLQSLCMVYGTEYCASDEIYSKIRERIKESVIHTPDVENEETKELGHINKVDPLGITYLRVRGMWGIENPIKVFNYIYTPEAKADFNFMCIINNDKWNSFDNTKELINISKGNNHLCISDINVKNPNNPAKLKAAKLITFYI